MPSLRIGSESSRLDIEVIQRHEGAAWTARLTLTDGPELWASVDGAYLIPEATEAVGLTVFFEEIAELHWTGWSGDRSWSSLEGNLAIIATWRRLGGAVLGITLRPEGQRWQVRATIEVDDMTLERLGPSARAVLLGAGKT